MSISSIGDIYENAAHTSHHASFGTFLFDRVGCRRVIELVSRLSLYGRVYYCMYSHAKNMPAKTIFMHGTISVI